MDKTKQRMGRPFGVPRKEVAPLTFVRTPRTQRKERLDTDDDAHLQFRATAPQLIRDTNIQRLCPNQNTMDGKRQKSDRDDGLIFFFEKNKLNKDKKPCTNPQSWRCLNPMEAQS